MNSSSPPIVVVISRSPLAAVKFMVPVDVAVAISTVSTEAEVKRPSMVAVPVSVPVIVRVVGGHVGGQFTAPRVSIVNVPLKGNSAPPCACVWSGVKVALVGAAGESGAWLPQAAAERQKTTTIVRMGTSVPERMSLGRRRVF